MLGPAGAGPGPAAARARCPAARRPGRPGEELQKAQLLEHGAGPARPAQRDAAGPARDRGPALGRPVHAGPGRVPDPVAARQPGAAGGHLPVRRAAPAPPAAAAADRLGAGAVGGPARAAPVRPRRGQPPSWPRSSATTRRPAWPTPIFDRSGGNAYLVEELAGAVQRRRRPGGPAAVAAGRAAQPGGRAERRTRSGCCAPPRWPAGRSPDRLLAEVAGTRRGRAVRGAARGGREPPAAWSTPAASGYAFRHALTRDAVYEDMLPGERVRLHAAYGEALAARPAAGRATRRALPAALAHHWYAALDLPRALPAAIDAARHAMACYAPGRGAAPPGAGAGDLAAGDRRGAAHRPGPGRGEPARGRGGLPLRRAGPGALPARRRPGRAAGRGRTRCAGRCCWSGTRSVAAGLGPPAPRRSRRWSRRWPCCPAAEADAGAHAVVLATLAGGADARLGDGARRPRSPGGRSPRRARPGPGTLEADAAITLGWAGLPGPAEAGLESAARRACALALELRHPADRAARLRQPLRRAGDCWAGTPRRPRGRGDGPGAGRAGRAGPHARLRT